MTDDDEPRLAPETIAALQEFLQEQALKEEKDDGFSENWQLSQFWYDEETTAFLSNSVLSLCDSLASIALISCPTLYPAIKTKTLNEGRNLSVALFEYDKRFSKYGSDFIFYDYNDPVNIGLDYRNAFDVIIVDPPFLSEECLTKTVETINFIKKIECKIILCTGKIMEELATKLLNVKTCSFEPKHKNNLANEFICMTNFGEFGGKC